MKHIASERALVGLALLIAPLALLFVALRAQFTDLGGAFSPNFFPVLVLWFWAGIAAISLAREVWRPSEGRAAMSGRTKGQIALVILAMGAFVYGLTRVGFLLSAIGFTLAVLLILRIRSPLLLVGFSILTPLAIFVLFHHGLGLPLPTSPFSYLF